jgi:hypothetical protein
LVADGAYEWREEIPPEQSDARFDSVQAEWREAFIPALHDEIDLFADDPQPPHTVRVEYVDWDAWECQAGRLVVQWRQNEATGG